MTSKSASNWGDPGKNDLRVSKETGEPRGEYLNTQSSRKQKANDSAGRPPSLADQMMQIQKGS